MSKIYNWIVENNLSLNADKLTATLFTLDQSETNKNVNHTINNILNPTVQHPKNTGSHFQSQIKLLTTSKKYH